MFGKLRNKLKTWLGKEKDAEDKPEEETQKEKPKKVEKTPKKQEKKETAKKKSQLTKDKSTSQESSPTEPAATVTETPEKEPEKKELSKEPAPTKPDATVIDTSKKTSTKSAPAIADTLEEPETLQEEVEDIKEEITQETKKKGFFGKLLGKVTESKLEQKHVDEIFEDLEMILLENNVALEVVDTIRENLSKALVGTEVKKDKIEDTIIQSLKDSIAAVLLDPPNLIKQINNHDGLYTIIFFGINGSGKTTSIAKLANHLKENNISCVLTAADTFRAAAIEQLETHAQRLDVPIIKGQYGADPTSVAFDAKKYAEKNNIKCLLIDTAGRMYTKENLIKQMEKIIRIIKPDLKIFVGESITGNDGTEQAKTFHEAVGIDGIILSKADVDEKGGTALSVSHITGKPIYFLGVGQNYADLEAFNKEKIMKNLGLD